MKERFANHLLLLAIFLLPWQTRWIFGTSQIGLETSQYGQLSFYLTELILFFVVLLRGRPCYQPENRWVIQAGYFFLGAAFFSLGFGDFFPIGLSQILHLIFAFALLTTVCDVRTDLKAIAVAFVSGLLIPAGLGWWQTITGSSSASTWLGLSEQHVVTGGTAVVETISGRMLRAYGTFPHPNIFGGFLAVGLVVLAWLVRFIHSRRTLIFSMVTAVVVSATLIITFSRSAWFGIVIGFLVLMSLMLLRRRLVPSRALPVILLGLVTVISTLGIFYHQVFARFAMDGKVEQISVVERTSQYRLFDEVFFVNPLFGVGPGAYPFVLSQIDPGGQVWAYQPIHNTFLLVLSELGIVGMLALLYLLLRVDQVSSKAAKTAGGMFGLCLGAVLIVIGLFDHYLFSLWPGLALSVLSLSFIVNWSSRLSPEIHNQT